jgi:hypothetical protein
MNNQNAALAFLIETIQRLKTKSPKFFKYWNIFNGAIAIIADVPTILSMFDVQLPAAPWTHIVTKIIGAAATWGWIMTKLTTERSTVTNNDEVVEAKAVKLPFTEKAEAKKLDAQDVVRVVTDPNALPNEQ